MRQTFKLKVFIILFIAIIISTISFSVISYGYYYQNLLEEINFSTALSLEQISHTTQNYLQDVIDKSTRIIFDENLSGYTYSTESNCTNSEYGEMAYKIIKEAYRTKQSSLLIDSIYICFNNNSRVLTDKGLFTFNEFYERSYLDKVREYLEKNRIQSYALDIRKFAYEDKQFYKQDHTGNVISIIKPFYNAYLQGFVIVNIRNTQLFYPIKLRSNSVDIGSSTFFVLSNSGQIITPDSMDITLIKPISDQYMSDSRKTQGYFSATINRKKYLVIFSNKSSFGWTHLIALPYTKVYGNIYIFKNTLIALNFLVALLGGLVAYFVSSKLYRPIKSLYYILSGIKTTLETSKSINDIDAITSDVKKIVLENNEIRTIFEKNSHVLKEVFLKQLITGKIQDEREFVEKFTQLQLHLDQDCFAIFIMCIDQWYNLTKKYDIIELNMLKYSILETACTSVPDRINGLYLVISESERIILLYNFSADKNTQDSQSHLVQIAKNIQFQIKEKLSLAATISVGYSVTGFRDISQSYTAALESLNYRFIFDSESIIDSKQLQSVQKSWNKPVYPFEQEKLLLLHITNNNSDKAMGLIDSILQYLVDNKCTYSIIKQYTLQLLSSISRYVDEQSIPFNIIFTGNDPSTELLYNMEMITDVNAFFKQIVQNLILYYESKKASHSKPFIQNVLCYIEANYHKDINLEIVADHYHISRQHFSRLFQEHTCELFNTYLNNIRLEKSISLLEDNQLRLKDICQMVGFNSPQYFIKLFKAKYHLTPAEYRKRNSSTPKENNITD